MPLTLPPGPFDGYIFDFDGTLADTMPIHYRAWLQAFKELKTPFVFEEDYFYSLGGTPTARIVGIFNEKYGTHYDNHEVAHHKEKIFEGLMHEAGPIHEVVEYARQFKAAGYPIAVATGGIRWLIEKTLAQIGLEGVFPIIITPVDVKHGKPAPDMFLLAAEKMGVHPKRTLVFEDAYTGIEAAKAAGMQYVVVPRPGKAAT